MNAKIFYILIQETSIKVVHGIGASLAFICGVIYLWGQVIIVSLTKPTLGSPFHNILRIVMIFITTSALITRMYILNQCNLNIK